MADATLLISLSPATAYATKRNIKFPGPTSREAALETAADTRIEDSLPTSLVVSGVDVQANGEA